MNLREERESPGQRLILQIPSLAIPDIALNSVDCVKDLAKLQPSAAHISHKVPIRQSMRDTLLL